jgi:hypothetical protein
VRARRGEQDVIHDIFWGQLSSNLKGVPSRFADRIPDVLEGFFEELDAANLELFRPADDEDRLAAARAAPK